MPLPEALSPSPLDVEGNPSRSPIPYQKEPQLLDRWCWAAVAVLVARAFYEDQWRQCDVANKVLQRGDCCLNNPVCNNLEELDRALDAVGHFNGQEGVPAELQDVKDSIDAGNPVCARVDLGGGLYHFVMIYDYSGDDLFIGDPGYDDARVPYKEYKQQWMDTYWTQP